MARFRLNLTQLHENSTYTRELASMVNATLPLWMKRNHAYPQEVTHAKARKERNKHWKPRLFGRHYTDNFQLRSLAGCSSGDCLNDVRLDEAAKERLRSQLPTSMSPGNDTSVCTQYFVTKSLLFDPCSKHYSDECSQGCKAPCFYETDAMGKMGRKHLARALSSLASFDAILIMDRQDDDRQSDFLADLMGVPRDAPFALKNAADGNRRVEKATPRERRSFYRGLLRRLGLGRLGAALHHENALDVQLYGQALRMNERMLAAWENETAAFARTDRADLGRIREPPPMAMDAEARPPHANTAKDSHVQDATLHDPDDAHHYGVIFVMYHKTGYVLTRFLLKEILELEIRARGYAEGKVQVNLTGYAIDYVDEKTGSPIAFGRRGSWHKMVAPPRRHHGISGCSSDFRLSAGKIYLQEAPDFFCRDTDLSARMLALPARNPDTGGRVKIVHFVRNPFEMALSNYFYHSQEKAVSVFFVSLSLRGRGLILILRVSFHAMLSA